MAEGPGRATGEGRAGRSGWGTISRSSACDFRKLGNRIEPGSADLLLTDPPWEAKLGPELAQVAARLLKPNGILACYTGVLLHALLPPALRGGRAAVRVDGGRGPQVPGDPQRRGGEEPVDADPGAPQGPQGAGSRSTASWRTCYRSEECDKNLHAWQQDVRTSVGPGPVAVPAGRAGGRRVPGRQRHRAAPALAGEARRFAGCEIDAKMIRVARSRVAEALAGQPVKEEVEAMTV